MTDECERSLRAAIDGEMLLLDPEVRASPARVLELLDTDFTEIGASGRKWDVESILTLPPGMVFLCCATSAVRSSGPLPALEGTLLRGTSDPSM